MPLITEITFDIKTYDIDIAGHVNNIVFIRWLEELRIKLFEQILPIVELIKENKFPVVVETSIKYKRQIKIGEICNAKMFVERFDHPIWVLSAQFNVGDKIAAIATQKCVIVDLQTNKIIYPPKEIVEKINK